MLTDIVAFSTAYKTHILYVLIFWKCRKKSNSGDHNSRQQSRKQSRVTSVCNISSIPLDPKHLKLLRWIKIEFSPLSYSPYQQQYIIRARSTGSCSSVLQWFTWHDHYFGLNDWVTEVTKCWTLNAIKLLLVGLLLVQCFFHSICFVFSWIYTFA